MVHLTSVGLEGWRFLLWKDYCIAIGGIRQSFWFRLLVHSIVGLCAHRISIADGMLDEHSVGVKSTLQPGSLSECLRTI